jgi:hypothetical protein
MNNFLQRDDKQYTFSEAIQASISSYLYDAYAADFGLLGDLDRWTQRRITDENMAKLALVLESDDPMEACYRDLIREIDTEAESGVYLVNPDAEGEHLRQLLDDPGVSGDLERHMDSIAPVILEDEARRSVENLDLVWVTVNAYHDRAHVDATVSEIILSHLMDDAVIVREMVSAMRAMQYAFHEDFVRRRCELPPVLDDRESRDLAIMINELSRRAGNHEDRNAAIRQRAQTF